MPKRDEFTDRKQRLFLESLAKTGVVLRACRAANISRQAVYVHRQNDPEFARAWDEADEQFTDLLEVKAHSLAFEGKETSLWNLLRGRRPKKYQQVLVNKHGGDGDHLPIPIQVYDYRAAIAPLAARPMDDSRSPGQAEGADELIDG